MKKYLAALIGLLFTSSFVQAQISGKSVSSFTTEAGKVLHVGDTIRIGRGSDINGAFRYVFLPSNVFTGSPQKFFTSSFAGSAVLIKDLKTTESGTYGIQTVAVIKGEGLLSGCIVINPAEEAGEIRTKPVQRTKAATAVPVASTNITDELIKLKQLLDAKVLTPAEFATQKNRLLKQQGVAVAASAPATSNASSFAAQTQTDNDITFKVTSVVGNKKSQTVTVTVVLLNKAANKEVFNTDVVSFTGEEGDEFKLMSGMVGKDSYPKTLFTDAPLKATYTFSGILPKVASVKMLPIPYNYYKPEYKKGEVQFRDLPITWR